MKIYRRIIPRLKALTVTFLMTISLSSAYSQPRSVGATYSFTGFSISYEHLIKGEDTFVDMSIKAETSEMFFLKSDAPGVSASVTLNYPVRNWLSSEGNKMSFIAGPGLLIGYGRDMNTAKGLYLGIKGKLGFECRFSRNITLSAFVSPTIGTHMDIHREYVRMKYYRNGLICGLIPEVGIKYAF